MRRSRKRTCLLPKWFCLICFASWLRRNRNTNEMIRSMVGFMEVLDIVIKAMLVLVTVVQAILGIGLWMVGEKKKAIGKWRWVAIGVVILTVPKQWVKAAMDWLEEMGAGLVFVAVAPLILANLLRGKEQIEEK